MTRRRWVAPALAALGVAMAAPASLAAGSAEPNDLAEMRDLVERLEARIDAQDEQLEHQGEMLHTYQKKEEREASSGLSSFLNDLEFGGWVATSYFYNFNNPGDGLIFGGNQGESGLHYPFHPDHNSFAVDQVWFEMEKPARPTSST